MGCGMVTFLKSDSGSLSYLAKDHFHFASYHQFTLRCLNQVITFCLNGPMGSDLGFGVPILFA